jgi:hypothetical protein
MELLGVLATNTLTTHCGNLKWVYSEGFQNALLVILHAFIADCSFAAHTNINIRDQQYKTKKN